MRTSLEKNSDAKSQFAQTQAQMISTAIGAAGTYSSTQSLARYLPQDQDNGAGLYAQNGANGAGPGSPPLYGGRPSSAVGLYTQEDYPQPPVVENQPYPVHVDARHGPMQEFIPSNVSALRERFNDAQNDAQMHFKPIVAKQVVRGQKSRKRIKKEEKNSFIGKLTQFTIIFCKLFALFFSKKNFCPRKFWLRGGVICDSLIG